MTGGDVARPSHRSPSGLAGAGGLGHGALAARVAGGRTARLPRAVTAGLPRGRDAGRRQDDLRAVRRGRAAGPPPGRPADHRRADRAPQAAVGRGRGEGRPADRSDVLRRQGQDQQRLRRCGRDVRRRGVNPLALRIRTERFKTLVILDEIHHAGDALSWGEGVREAFEPAARRLALTGTPFRSDVNPIPFVTYARGRTASRGRPPTTPTATRRRWPTTSCGRCSSSPTPARCSGAPARVTRSLPAWANR